jgi:hypothetical protein
MPFDVSTLVIVLIIVIYMLSSIKILAEYLLTTGQKCSGPRTILESSPIVNTPGHNNGAPDSTRKRVNFWFRSSGGSWIPLIRRCLGPAWSPSARLVATNPRMR